MSSFDTKADTRIRVTDNPLRPQRNQGPHRVREPALDDPWRFPSVAEDWTDDQTTRSMREAVVSGCRAGLDTFDVSPEPSNNHRDLRDIERSERDYWSLAKGHTNAKDRGAKWRIEEGEYFSWEEELWTTTNDVD